ncbi:potassium channel KOR2-like [Zingiber officinale]|uniref:potassium channel KOR2-like n=1 Tax=Zingiber officinale TaxID=94328 RepID=UPI001C4AB35E|nr:potassium channel KOR2-like [Zingiber officinale]
MINPDGRWYGLWVNVIVLWAIYSIFFTSLEFGFFRGLPEQLEGLDCAQIIFLVDIVIQFFVPYRDLETYKMISHRRKIALRYLRGSFAVDLLGCFPWDSIYKATGNEAIRFLTWVRVFRARKIIQFFKMMEKDIRINYLVTRIVKLLMAELYCAHTAACVFHYLALMVPQEQEGNTWIGSLTLGDYQYKNFRDIHFWRRYITSLYFSFVTLATVGYGDIHPVNTREMIFVMVYISLTMILGAYVIGNMTALIVKGSKTEQFRDRMSDLIEYMNIKKLEKGIRSQIKDHFRLQYENSYRKEYILENIPVAVRSKISRTLYLDLIRKVPLFKGCSEEFLYQIVMRLNEELFLPGEMIVEQGSPANRIYVVLQGYLEELFIGEDGAEEPIVELTTSDTLGDVALLCHIPQPFAVRVCELCKVLLIEKQSWGNILQLHMKDHTQMLINLLEKRREPSILQLEPHIRYLIAKQEEELALGLSSTAYYGDINRLKLLINGGADPNTANYDGRTALHMAAGRGHEKVVKFLIKRGVDVNCIDKFGNSPLLEALKAGHELIAAVLVENGGIVNLNDAGRFLCEAVTDNNVKLLRGLLKYGVDPNSRNYDERTPLHVAASQGLHHAATMLIESGADVLSKDRWGNTAVDEGRRCASQHLVNILEDALVKQENK